jgi:hypothetical protein
MYALDQGMVSFIFLDFHERQHFAVFSFDYIIAQRQLRPAARLWLAMVATIAADTRVLRRRNSRKCLLPLPKGHQRWAPSIFQCPPRPQVLVATKHHMRFRLLQCQPRMPARPRK